MKKSLPIYLTLIALAAYGGWVWLGSASGDHAPKGGPGGGGRGSAPPVTLAAAAPQIIGSAVTAIGSVQSRESVTITAQQSGLVETLHFQDGDSVAAGALLVTLHDDEEQARVREAEARVADQKRQLQRLQDLSKSNSVSRAAIDEREAAVNVAEAQLAVARATLDKRYIRAPFAGQLGARMVSPGALVSAGLAITTLDDIRHVRVEFSLPETQVAQVRKNMAVQARSAALGGKTFQGKLTHVDARLNPTTRALSLRAELQNTDQGLRPGMLVDLALGKDEAEVLAIPEGAILSLADEHFVFRVGEDKTAKRVPIKIGRRGVGVVEVLEGLSPGDQVIVEGIHKVRDGQSVAPSQP